MKFDPPLLSGTLIQRYKRFLADVRLDDGETLTAHCANPGSMLGLVAPGNLVCLSDSQNPKRKLQMTLELVQVDGAWVGVNTHLANKLAEAAITDGRIAPLSGYTSIHREIKYGENSRIDLLLEAEGKPSCYVEVKSVTLSRSKGLAEFPDSVTTRGTKHLGELSAQVAAGARAVQLFVVQRSDCQTFTPAADIDPVYAAALSQAKQDGVEILAMTCQISPDGIAITNPIPVELA
ncbi:MAG: DNA/RNA nuclease SfsA [Robiginitomaculum sp.]|nr:DNA/RNA nuclease SfsA [Robiginitomaculum sp.]